MKFARCVLYVTFRLSRRTTNKTYKPSSLSVGRVFRSPAQATPNWRQYDFVPWLVCILPHSITTSHVRIAISVEFEHIARRLRYAMAGAIKTIIYSEYVIDLSRNGMKTGYSARCMNELKRAETNIKTIIWTWTCNLFGSFVFTYIYIYICTAFSHSRAYRANARARFSYCRRTDDWYCCDRIAKNVAATAVAGSTPIDSTHTHDKRSTINTASNWPMGYWRGMGMRAHNECSLVINER